jgi:hypothetical protein
MTPLRNKREEEKIPRFHTPLDREYREKKRLEKELEMRLILKE